MHIVIFHSSDVNQLLRTNITLSSPPSLTLSMLMLAMFISQRNNMLYASLINMGLVTSVRLSELLF